MSSYIASAIPSEDRRKLEEAVPLIMKTVGDDFRKFREREKACVPRILLVGPSASGKNSFLDAVLELGGHEGVQAQAGDTSSTDSFAEYGPLERIPLYVTLWQGVEGLGARAQRRHVLKYVGARNGHVNERNHVHIVWYFPDERWGSSDITSVKKLSKFVKVIVVISKCDERARQVDPTTGTTNLELIRAHIKSSVPSVGVVEFAEGVPSKHWMPRQCRNGHHISARTVNNREGTWKCFGRLGSTCCNDEGHGGTGFYSREDLFDKTVKGIPSSFQPNLRKELVKHDLLKAQLPNMKEKNAKVAQIISNIIRVAMRYEMRSFVVIPGLSFLLGLETWIASSMFRIYDVDPEAVSADTWLELHTLVLDTVGLQWSGVAIAIMVLLTPRDKREHLPDDVSGALIGALGTAIAAVCSSLLARSSSKISKTEFAEKLRKVAATISVKCFVKDTILVSYYGRTHLTRDIHLLINSCVEGINEGHLVGEQRSQGRYEEHSVIRQKAQERRERPMVREQRSQGQREEHPIIEQRSQEQREEHLVGEKRAQRRRERHLVEDKRAQGRREVHLVIEQRSQGRREGHLVGEQRAQGQQEEHPVIEQQAPGRREGHIVREQQSQGRREEHLAIEQHAEGRPRHVMDPVIGQQTAAVPVVGQSGTKLSVRDELRPYDVFISHAGPDKNTIAIPLYHMLQAAGFKCFLDIEELRVGDNAEQKMIDAMNTARIGIVILSPEYGARRWTMKELLCFQRRIKLAKAKGEPGPVLIPVFYRLNLCECKDPKLYDYKTNNGQSVFYREGFFSPERQRELNTEMAMASIRALTTITGIENIEGASNEDEEGEAGRLARHALVRRIAESVVQTHGISERVELGSRSSLAGGYARQRVAQVMYV